MVLEKREFCSRDCELQCAIAPANRLKPLFWWITGDLINQGANAAQAAEYRRIAAKIDTRIPIYAIPGEITMWRTNRRRRVSPHTASESGAITIRSVREAGRVSSARRHRSPRSPESSPRLSVHG